MSSPPPVAFDFGQNWQEFSASALTSEKVSEAREHFAQLIAPLELRNRSFLDIGFGQGLSLLVATRMGARTVGCDINPKCAAVLATNQRFFPGVALPPVVVGSILDEKTVAQLQRQAALLGEPEAFDFVHSWGVLHHTGDMRTAMRHATNLVKPKGHFIVAIYNRHWSSKAWWLIKRMYVSSPRFLQKAMVGIFYPVIYLAKWAATGKRPREQGRGMNFYYDIVDWVGGYPYEYASVKEMTVELGKLGFSLGKSVPAEVPTGCNQFIFQRDSGLG